MRALLSFTFDAPLPAEAVLSAGCGCLWLPTCLEGIPGDERKRFVTLLCSLHYCQHPPRSPPSAWYRRGSGFLPASRCPDHGEEGRGRGLLGGSSSPQSPPAALPQLMTASAPADLKPGNPLLPSVS